ncbi:MAG: aldo/keto reductase [Actinobacteria bacterium]|nr:aldo/keto reductase [Actinomycetota bacterium]
MTSPSANLVQPGPRRVGPFDVGPIGFGCWRLTTSSTDEAGALVAGALDLGCTLVDTADVYGLDWGGDGFGACEDRLGQVLLQQPSLRDRMVLATKGGIVPGVPYDSSASGITQACEASLRRLHVDHVDLYQIHRPDLFTHPAELAEALIALHERGLAREFGVSNHTPAQTAALQQHLPMALVSTQPEFSAARVEPMFDGTFDHALLTGLSVLAWSPLAGGRLATGEGLPTELMATLDHLAAVHDTDRASVALAFVLAHPVGAVAIVGTQTIARLEAAVEAVHVPLSRADVYAIVQAAQGRPLP